MKYSITSRSPTSVGITFHFDGSKKHYQLNVLPHELQVIDNLSETVFLQRFWKRIVSRGTN